MTRLIRIVGPLLGIAGCVLSGSSATAGLISLSPGGTVSPTGGTVAGDLGTGYVVEYAATYDITNGVVSATLTADAVKLSGGTYDFLYQLTNTSASSNIDGLNVTDYTKFTTSVDYLTDGSTISGGMFTSDGTQGSYNVTRTPDAATVTFNFDTQGGGGTPLAAGTTSNVMLVATDATSYSLLGTGTATSISNGGTSMQLIVQPSSVPEPSSLVLGGLALLTGASMCGFRRLCRKHS